MTTEDTPFEYEYDLGDVSRNGVEISLEADANARARIAKWAEVAAVDSFAAKVLLRKLSADRYSLDADLTADVVQECVVTLEPVKSRIEKQVHRELHLVRHMRRAPPTTEVVSLTVSAEDDDGPEEIDSPDYDLAAPLLEELVLALDPYPRAPGVEFAAPPDAEPARENPFAVLKSLKNRA